MLRKKLFSDDWYNHVYDVFDDFDYFLKRSNQQIGKRYTPFEKDGLLTHFLEVPGMTEEDIKVSWDKDILTIEGKSKIVQKEISYCLSMPGIDPSTLEASCQHGILTVTARASKKEDGCVKVQVKKK